MVTFSSNFLTTKLIPNMRTSLSVLETFISYTILIEKSQSYVKLVLIKENYT